MDQIQKKLHEDDGCIYIASKDTYEKNDIYIIGLTNNLDNKLDNELYYIDAIKTRRNSILKLLNWSLEKYQYCGEGMYKAPLTILQDTIKAFTIVHNAAMNELDRMIFECVAKSGRLIVTDEDVNIFVNLYKEQMLNLPNHIKNKI